MKKLFVPIILLSFLSYSCSGFFDTKDKIIEPDEKLDEDKGDNKDNNTNVDNNPKTENDDSQGDNPGDNPGGSENPGEDEQQGGDNPGSNPGDNPSTDNPDEPDEGGSNPEEGGDNPGGGSDNPGENPGSGDNPEVEPDINIDPPSDDNIEITGIEFVVKELNMYLGHTYKLSYQTLPTNTSKVTTYFKSDIPKIVSVSSDGTLSANKVGKTQIKVITGEGFIDRCIVNVIENPNFKFPSPCLDLYINSTKPFALSGSGITYESDNSEIASISSSGQIQTYGNAGRVVLTARKGNNITKCDLRVFLHNQDLFKFTDIDSSTCSIDGFISSDEIVANVVVPFENSSGKKVVKISSNAFSTNLPGNKRRKSILLPNSIKEFGNSSIAYGEADSFYTPYYLETIGPFAFMNFYFKSIELNDNLKEIGMRSFINCHSFEEIIIPSNTILREDCFHDCNKNNDGSGGLKRVYIQEGASLDYSTKDFFFGCYQLEQINIPTSFTSLPERTFYGITRSTLKNGVFVPKTITEIKTINYYGSTEEEINSKYFDIFLEHEELPPNFSDRNHGYCLYSKNQPTTSGSYWHYVNGEITKW